MGNIILDIISELKKWKPRTYFYLIVILGSGIWTVVSYIKHNEISTGDIISIGLLVILAYDAIMIRSEFFEKLEQQNYNLQEEEKRTQVKIGSLKEEGLIYRSELPDVEVQGLNSKKICIISPAMSTLISKIEFFKKKFIDDCTFNILLIDPKSTQAIKAWSTAVDNSATTKLRISENIKTLKGIANSCNAVDKCHIRGSNVFIPYSMFATDPDKENGEMVIEQHGYKTPDDRRPCIFLRRNNNLFRFEQYMIQFDDAWKDGNEI